MTTGQIDPSQIDTGPRTSEKIKKRHPKKKNPDPNQNHQRPKIDSTLLRAAAAARLILQYKFKVDVHNILYCTVPHM